MSCWPFSGRDDCAAQAGDGFHHGQDGDVLGCRRLMRVVHEAVVRLDCAMLMLTPTMLSSTALRLNTDGAPTSMWHVS